MESKRVRFARVALGLMAIVAVVAVAGCSSTGTTGVETGDTTNRVSGTVRSDAGQPLEDITIWLGAKHGEGPDVTYQIVTDQYGHYEFEDIAMESGTVSESTYTLYGNRTPSRTISVNIDYSTWQSTVNVPRSGEITADIELLYNGYDPEAYIDN